MRPWRNSSRLRKQQGEALGRRLPPLAMKPALLRDPRQHFATGRQPALPRMPGSAGAMQLPAPPPPSLEAVTAATASGLQPRAVMPPPQPLNASARIKVEAPRAPHLYPSQSLFPRESASISDAVSGLKALASHTDGNTPPRPLQPVFPGQLRQPQARAFELPALNIPHRQTSYQEHHHRISPVLVPGEATAIKSEHGAVAHPQLLPPPLIARRVTVGDSTNLRPHHAAVDMQGQRLPSMSHLSPPLVSLLGRKNKRGEERGQECSPMRLQWEDSAHGRLDPTASPPRPTADFPTPPGASRRRLNPVVAAPPTGAVTTFRVPSTSPVARSTAPASEPPQLARRVSASQWRHELAPRDRSKTRERIQRGLQKQSQGDYETLVSILAAMEEELLHIRTTSREHYFDQALELSGAIATAQLDRSTSSAPPPPPPPPPQ